MWDWDIAADTVYVSPEYRALYGLAPDAPVTYERWLTELVHPEDRARLAEAGRQLLAAGTEYAIEFRILHPTRGECWLTGTGRLFRDAAGRPVRFVGMNTDITAHKREEQALQESEDRLRRRNEGLLLLSEASANLLAATDPNRMMEELFMKVGVYLGADVFFNYMVDDTAPRGVPPLRLDAAGGIDAAARAAFARLNMGQALCGISAQERRAVFIQDVQHSDNPHAAGVQRLEVRTYACHLLLAGARLLGTLSFGSRTKDRFEDDELDFIRTVSHYVATAKERLRAEAACGS